MVSCNEDASQEHCATSKTTLPFDRPQARANSVFKSGPLFISSKGIGWTSWKKRWFILTRTSLVFFRSDPSALPQKGGEVNLTLGGIDLNSSGSVIVRADKKLLTVSFPNGGDGRGFTLKAETSEDLYEWKAALESALAQAPSAHLVTGHNGIFQNDPADTIEGSLEQWRERRPVKSLVIGRPILLALEDIDGSPSFLEKALRFIEQYGIKVEGILRQAADVEEVELRVQEYEQGKIEFSPDEDAHVVADCVKHVLRELPSSPVPASCCVALLEAYRTSPDLRVDALRDVIFETFPEPNRRLLQRVLKMMHAVSCHKSVNRMSASAVAACMAPLLLRALLAGDCELEGDFDISGDGSSQLLAAAAAANHAHVIVTTLLEEYDSIFGDDSSQRGSCSPDMYTDSEISCSEESMEDHNLESADDGYHGEEDDLDPDDDYEHSGTISESSGNAGSDLYVNKDYSRSNSDADIRNGEQINITAENLMNQAEAPSQHLGVVQENLEHDKVCVASDSELHDRLRKIPSLGSPELDASGLSSPACLTKATSKPTSSSGTTKRPKILGRTGGRRNLSMESINFSSEDEILIQKLQITKNDLESKLAKEAKGNAILEASLERRKQALHERRQMLEQDVARLQEQLQKERDLRATLEAGLNMHPGNLLSDSMDPKIRAELEEIALAEADVESLKKRIADLHLELNQHNQHGHDSICESCRQHRHVQGRELTRQFQKRDIGTTSGKLRREGTGRSKGARL
ncbi:rho GTPase-activating protein 7-like isoform X2 [Nymphaea colorata]|uniref:rho GTPase-activating protein 7-like isoform X2 n=1 Tax=Nymphaea colorata TaxID=210225 RepID=UPI00129DE87E|nr:rho GTPase-activating protein 7-like isoform X2 [Nymphaea colorata]